MDGYKRLGKRGVCKKKGKGPWAGRWGTWGHWRPGGCPLWRGGGTTGPHCAPSGLTHPVAEPSPTQTIGYEFHFYLAYSEGRTKTIQFHTYILVPRTSDGVLYLFTKSIHTPSRGDILDPTEATLFGWFWSWLFFPRQFRLSSEKKKSISFPKEGSGGGPGASAAPTAEGAPWSQRQTAERRCHNRSHKRRGDGILRD